MHSSVANVNKKKVMLGNTKTQLSTYHSMVNFIIASQLRFMPEIIHDSRRVK
jgi:hypothetical protein